MTAPVVFCADIVRCAFEAPIARNVDWLEAALRPSLNALGLRTRRIHPKTRHGDFDVETFARLCGIAAATDGWRHLFSADALPAGAERMLESAFSDSYVIGFGLPPYLLGWLARSGRTFVDMEFDPVRFASDLYLRVRTNDPRAAATFSSLAVDDDEILQETGLFAARLAKAGWQWSLDELGRTLLFVGQMPDDAALFADGRHRSPAEFVDTVAHLAAGRDSVLIRPHPYATTLDHLAPLHAALGNAMYTGANTYALLLHPNVEMVVALSSSVLAEAELFGKQTRALIVRDVSAQKLAHLLTGSDFRVDAQVFHRTTWASILAGAPPQARAGRTGATIRRSYGTRWGAPEAILPAPATPQLHGGVTVHFGAGGPENEMLICGWGTSGCSGVWSGARHAVLQFLLERAFRPGCRVKLGLKMLLTPSRPRRVAHVRTRGGTRVECVFSGSGSIAEAAAHVPIVADDILRGGRVELMVESDDVLAPAMVGPNQDGGELGVGLESIELVVG